MKSSLTFFQKLLLLAFALMWLLMFSVLAFAQPAPAAKPQWIWLSPATSTMPALEGTNLKLLPTLYEGSRNQLYPHRQTNHLKTLAPNGDAVYDADACDEIAAHYLAAGVTRIVLDWERPDSEGNRQAYLRTVWRLQDRGLTVSRYGAEPWASEWDRLYVNAANSGEVHCVFYQFTLDADLWLSHRTKQLDYVRKTYPDRKVFVWVWPFHEQDGDGPGNGDIPVHAYVGDKMWRAQLAWAKRHKVILVVWNGREQLTDQGDFKPFDTAAAWYSVVREFAVK